MSEKTQNSPNPPSGSSDRFNQSSHQERVRTVIAISEQLVEKLEACTLTLSTPEIMFQLIKVKLSLMEAKGAGYPLQLEEQDCDSKRLRFIEIVKNFKEKLLALEAEYKDAERGQHVNDEVIAKLRELGRDIEVAYARL